MQGTLEFTACKIVGVANSLRRPAQVQQDTGVWLVSHLVQLSNSQTRERFAVLGFSVRDHQLTRDSVQ